MPKEFARPLPRSRFLRGCNLLLRRYFRHDVARDSAALAYYLLFTLFPFMIFISSLLGLLELDIAGILNALSEVMPKDVVDLIGGYLSYVSQTSSRRMLWFGLVFSIYFPMRAANCLMRSVRKAYHLTPPIKPFRHMLKTLFFTVTLIVTIVLALVLLTVGDRLLVFLSAHIHIPQLFVSLWTSLRFPVLGLVMAFVLWLLYALSQDRRQPLKNVAPGIAFSLVLWMILSMGYSFYVEHFASYSVIYYSIGTVIVLLIWLYMSATTLVMGAEFNGTLISLRIDKSAGADQEPEALSDR